MTKLSEIANANGFTMKKLAELTDIPYTTLMSMANTNMEQWESKKRQSIEKILGDLNKPVLQPFVKWVGGKRQLLKEIKQFMPSSYNFYFEPFVGGGALFLNLAPQKAYISDKNEELINCWQVIKHTPNELLELLQYHQNKNSKEYYLEVRSVDRNGKILTMSPIERAARFIYLNKAGYNGLWRVNAKGQNNVPYTNPKKLNLVMTERILSISEFLNKCDIKIAHKDFTYVENIAKKNDFIYFDPPYIPLTITSSFTSYTKDGFGEVQQILLRDLALKLTQAEVKVMISNSDTQLTRELYKSPCFNIYEVSAKRMINSNAKKRGKVNELIITNY